MRWLFRLCVLLILVSGLLAAWMYHFSHAPLPIAGGQADFTIRPGSSLRSSAHQMAAAGVPLAPWAFILLGRGLGKAGAIQAGSYEVASGTTPWQLLQKLTRGDVSQAEVLLVEGWTFRQIRQALAASPDLHHETRDWTDRQLLDALAISMPAEGWFFPDTYLFARGSSDLALLRRAHAQMNQVLEAEWARRDAGLPYRTPYEALIMASIVEKETGRAEDRAHVAAVFVNRLRKGMRLQTDPTVIYGLGEQFDGNLRKRDLLADGPYNTYQRGGLPPTPIAMPGLAAIQAALHPADSQTLYFVARGDGSSQFSRTLDEHNRAVVRYQLRRNRQAGGSR